MHSTIDQKDSSDPLQSSRGQPVRALSYRPIIKNDLSRGLTKGWFSKRVVLADVPPERKPERGYIRMFPRNEKPQRGYVRMFPRKENRNEGTFAKTTLLRNRLFISQWFSETIFRQLPLVVAFGSSLYLSNKAPHPPNPPDSWTDLGACHCANAERYAGKLNPSVYFPISTYKVQKSNSKLPCAVKQHSLALGVCCLHFQSVRHEEKRKITKSIIFPFCRFSGTTKWHIAICWRLMSMSSTLVWHLQNQSGQSQLQNDRSGRIFDLGWKLRW